MVVTPTADLASEILEQTGENIYLCYQCKKCTAGCPVAVYFDLAPHQFVRALQFGQKDLVLNSRTVWLCTQCETCVTRCPQDIGIPAIIDELRIMARREGVKPQVQAIPFFYDAALRGINLFGRMFEAGLMGELYTRLVLTGNVDYKQLLGKDMPMALKLLRDGKLGILPSLARYPKRRMQKIRSRASDELRPSAERVVDPGTIAYYPGCSLHGTSKEYDISVRAAMEKMQVGLEEPEGWVCCGTTPAHSTDHVLSTIMPLKNASLIEESGHSYVTVPCPSCFIRLRTAIRDIADPELQRQVALRETSLAPPQDAGPDAEQSYVPSRDLQVDHLLATITDHIGYEKVAQAVTKPLEGLKVACYYGCVITRPPKLTGVENYEYPTNMDRLMETLGAESLDWSHKTECCGVSLGITQLPIALGMTEKVLRDAKASGAEAVVVACPLCHVNLDSRQKQIEEEFSETFDLPVFYLTQLMGLAFGVASDELGLEKHFVDPFSLLSAKGLS